jgi:hypothetical protein
VHRVLAMVEDRRELHLHSIELLWGRCRRARANSCCLRARSESLISLSRELMRDVKATRLRIQAAKDNDDITGELDDLALRDLAAVWRDAMHEADALQS